MPINHFELIQAAELVAKKQEMHVTAQYAIGGAAFVACTSLFGAIIGGPVGLGIGGVFGSGAAAIYTKGKFKSVVSIIQEDLSLAEKLQLADHLRLAIKDFQITDLAGLLVLLRSNEALFLAVSRTVLTFFMDQKSFKIKYDENSRLL